MAGSSSSSSSSSSYMLIEARCGWVWVRHLGSNGSCLTHWPPACLGTYRVDSDSYINSYITWYRIALSCRIQSAVSFRAVFFFFVCVFLSVFLSFCLFFVQCCEDSVLSCLSLLFVGVYIFLLLFSISVIILVPLKLLQTRIHRYQRFLFLYLMIFPNHVLLSHQVKLYLHFLNNQ